MSKEWIKFPQLSQSTLTYTITFILGFKLALSCSFGEWKSTDYTSHADQRLECNLQHHWSGCDPQTLKGDAHFTRCCYEWYQCTGTLSSGHPKTTITLAISAPHTCRTAQIDSHLPWEWSHFHICPKMDEEPLLHNDRPSTYLSICGVN